MANAHLGGGRASEEHRGKRATGASVRVGAAAAGVMTAAVTKQKCAIVP